MSPSNRRNKRLIEKQYHTLRVLSSESTSKSLYKSILKESKDPLIGALSQCAKNLLYNKNFLSDKKLSTKISKKRPLFEFLSAPNNTVPSKRKKLITEQQIIKSILPTILNYYANVSSDSTEAEGGRVRGGARATDYDDGVVDVVDDDEP